MNYKMPIREQNSNKGTFGNVLNFCGSENYIGAAYLATVSSLKVGAGFSALATTQQVINSVSSLLPEAVYLTREQGLEQLNNFSVVLVGCGIGIVEESKKLFEDVLSQIDSDIPIIIDADGLNILSKMPVSILKSNQRNAVITPHPLEASRLLGVSLDYVLDNLEDTAKALSVKYKCVVALKTHRTIICNGKDIYVNQNGNSALAKAGSGDVLAGIIAGLLAQKMSVFEATKLGVYLHSRAGEIASEDLTEYSVIASDIPRYLHRAIKELL